MAMEKAAANIDASEQEALLRESALQFLQGAAPAGRALLAQGMAGPAGLPLARAYIAHLLRALGAPAPAGVLFAGAALSSPYPQEAAVLAVESLLEAGSAGAASLVASLYRQASADGGEALAPAHIAADIARGDLPAAQARLDRLLQADAPSPAAQTLRRLLQAALLLYRGEAEAAQALLAAAPDALESPQGIRLLALAHERVGDAAAARQALAGMPAGADADAVISAAKSLLRLEAPDLAQKLLQGIVRPQGIAQRLHALYLLARCAQETEGMDKAGPQYEALCALCVSMERDQGAAALSTSLIRALCCLRLARYEEAQRLLTFLIDAYPDQENLYVLRAAAGRLSGAADQGAADIQAARRLTREKTRQDVTHA